MRKQGHISRWNGARGFGFIRSPETPAEVFFHVRDFAGSPPPADGLRVVFEEIHVGGKGPRAMAVRPLGTAPAAAAPGRAGSVRSSSAHSSARGAASGRRPHSKASQRPAPAGSALAWTLMVAWAATLAWLVAARHLPVWVLGAVLALNLATVAAYALDKQAARTGGWRTSERQLHLLALAGGWPGAWFAQQRLRHKSSKQTFRAVYWATVVAHCSVLAVAVHRWTA